MNNGEHQRDRSEDSDRCEACAQGAEKARAGTPLEAFVEKGLVRKECKELYANVVACMEKAEGNISPCQKQWASFAKCHSKGQS